jgi:transketolase
VAALEGMGLAQLIALKHCRIKVCDVMSTSSVSLEQLSINTIRTLSMDGVQAANSGHPGTPMALAPVTYSLWNRLLRYDPATPNWPGRDRFVLSCGHASMLLYSTLHLAGVKKADGASELSITLDNIRNFRQLDSPCAGHPEFGEAAGIETTTGPLGQGIGNSVGMAIAAKWFAATYDRAGFELFDYDTFALCSDGDIMEGIGCEAASLAGHLKLSNLCWIYDDNSITIEGDTDLSFSENAATRFEGLGWRTVVVEDANDLDEIGRAFQTFAATDDRPTLIILRSIIGFGSPNKAGTHGAHGAPLGDEEIRLTKSAYGWPADAKFHVPSEVVEDFGAGIGTRGQELREQWQADFAKYEQQFPAEAGQLKNIWNRELPTGWDSLMECFPADEKGMASRVSSGKSLNQISANLPWLIGGSADLAPSNNTRLLGDADGDFGPKNYAGRNMHFGIREHAMAAACNGMALSGLRSFGGTFFVFTDYMRPSMRLSAIMNLGVIYVLTHDSIGLGEDGPTHQPVEHLAACRGIPNLLVMRPADANEVSQAYRVAMQIGNRPVAMVLTRQNLPTLDRQVVNSPDVARGAYIVKDCDGDPQVILMGTGSELQICLDAGQQLNADGIAARVVSVPCLDLFIEQDAAYQESVLPAAVTARVAVEAGIRQCWDGLIGLQGKFIGMNSFGASAPFEQLYQHFGITTEATVAAAKDSINGI